MPLLRRRPIQNLKSQVYHTQLHAQVGKGVRLEFKFCLVGLGKDAGATASTDWIAFHPRTRSRSTPHPRRQQDDTRHRGTLHLHSGTSPDDSEQLSLPV